MGRVERREPARCNFPIGDHGVDALTGAHQIGANLEITSYFWLCTFQWYYDQCWGDFEATIAKKNNQKSMVYWGLDLG